MKFEFAEEDEEEATPAAKDATKAEQPGVTKKEEKGKTQKKEKATKQTDGNESSSSKGEDDENDSDSESDDEDTPMHDQPAAPEEEEAAAEEFEFRLFSTSAPQKIVLPSKEEEEGAGETVIADRPISYYIRGELTAEQQEQFRQAAVTAQDIMEWAKQRAWGLEVPWRVKKIVVTVKGKKAEGVAEATAQHGKDQGQAEVEGGKKKKKRLGKKGRIAFRIKEKARKEKEEAEMKQKMTKEEHLKEKKKRLNREKKLKRRQKEKEKKMAAGGKAESSVGDAMSAVGQDSDSE